MQNGTKAWIKVPECVEKVSTCMEKTQNNHNIQKCISWEENYSGAPTPDTTQKVW